MPRARRVSTRQQSRFLYKGAGPGTHWFVNDPRLTGFPVGRGPGGLAAIVRHIVNYSWPSPYTSFSASFAVACSYALVGPAGVATKGAPGFVYEIDPSLARGLGLISPPERVIRRAPKASLLGMPTHHDGGQDLIVGIAGARRAILTRTPRRPSNPTQPAGPPKPGSGAPPMVTPELRAAVFALRDAEVLATRLVPAACVVRRYLVY